MCAALANVEEDYPEWHAFDTVKGGDYLVDQPAAHADDAGGRRRRLSSSSTGACRSTARRTGKIDQRRFGGHTRNHGEAPVKRACYAADRTGHMILQTLYQQCVKRDVRFFNEFYVPRPADDRRRVQRRRRLRARDRRDPRVPVQGRAVRHRRLRADVQGHLERARPHRRRPGGRAPPRASRSRTWSCSSSTRRACTSWAILLSEAVARRGRDLAATSDGERFMERYAPTIKDLAPRDMVSRAIYQEIKEGRGAGPNEDYVYLDVRHLPREVIEEKLPDVTEFARVYLGVEPTTEPVPIQPTAHYAMGGIPTERRRRRWSSGRTRRRCPGLYAAGECACVCVHGANRLGTNSLLDIVVFGRRGGAHMAEFARRPRCPPLPDEPRGTTLELLDGDPHARTRGERRRHPRELQDHMFDLAFVVRQRGGPPEDAGHPRRPPRALREGRASGQGQRVQHRPDGGRGARVPAGLRRPLVAGRPRPRREPGRRTTARTTRCATTPTGSSTRWHTGRRTARSVWSSSP